LVITLLVRIFLVYAKHYAGKEITLSPWSKQIDGKTRTMLYLRHGQEDIKWAWTKDNPGNMPEMKQIKVKGQVVWDDSERQEFFEKHLNDIFMPQVKAVSSVKKLDSYGAADITEDPGDDLPF
jgi:hypothetical protein